MVRSFPCSFAEDNKIERLIWCKLQDKVCSPEHSYCGIRNAQLMRLIIQADEERSQ